MLNVLKNFFRTENSQSDKNDNDDLLLLCGLMIEAANTDGKIDIEEINKISEILESSFKEEPAQIRLSLDKAIKNRDNSKSLFYYTSKFNKEFTHQRKIILIETLWEIILSDGEVHDYESNLIRRLCGLLYISDVDSGNAKQRALNKVKSQNDIRS